MHAVTVGKGADGKGTFPEASYTVVARTRGEDEDQSDALEWPVADQVSALAREAQASGR